MGIINWDKPKKRKPKEEWQNQSFDGGPPGGFVPNMSDKDRRSWKGKLVGVRSDSPQVEIRKDYFVVVVSLGEGYKYKHYTRDETKGINLHIGTSAPIQLSFEEWEEFRQAVEEATEVLKTGNKEPWLAELDRVQQLTRR